MNPNQPNPPASDDNVIHFDLDHETNAPKPSALTDPSHAAPNVMHRNNFVDESEEGLFDFDLEDLEKLFNPNNTHTAMPSEPNLSSDTPANFPTHLPSKNEPITTSSSEREAGLEFENFEDFNDFDDFKAFDTPVVLQKKPDLTTDLDTSVIPTPVTTIAPPSDTLNQPNDIEKNLEKIPTTPPVISDISVETANNHAKHHKNSPENDPDIKAPSDPTIPPEPQANPIPASSNDTENLIAPTVTTTLATSALATNALHKPAPAKKGFFSQLGNKKPRPSPMSSSFPPNNSVPPLTTLSTVKKPNKNNKPLFILLALLLLGALAWLASQFFADPEATPAPKATPASAVVATSVPASTQTTVPTATLANANPAAINPVSSTMATSSEKNAIKPEEILSAPLPADNAIAKEEIDRLADQSKQLSQQEKMKEEQLKMMNELSSKKEERIALLEKQIAILEAQKGKK